MEDQRQENTAISIHAVTSDGSPVGATGGSIPESTNQVESPLPVGSPDKSRAHAGEPDEQYPIPAARPNPFQENPSG